MNIMNLQKRQPQLCIVKHDFLICAPEVWMISSWVRGSQAVGVEKLISGFLLTLPFRGGLLGGRFVWVRLVVRLS